MNDGADELRDGEMKLNEAPYLLPQLRENSLTNIAHDNNKLITTQFDDTARHCDGLKPSCLQVLSGRPLPASPPNPSPRMNS